MTSTESANIALVREYLNAVQNGEALEGFFTEDVLQVEMPNRLNPRGGQSDLAAILVRSVQGRKMMQKQTFEILSEVAQGQRLALEARWTGVLAVPVGSLQAGASMTAHFAMFFEFRGGKISLQRNYDCFEPIASNPEGCP